MGNPFSGGDQPEDCQTSQEAQSIADRMKIFAEGRMEDDGMTCAGSHFSANSAWNEYQRYQNRADELRKQGK